MELTEQYTLPVSQQRAWEALNDTAVLRAVIPGCEDIVADGENAYTVSMRAAVGPVKAHFKGRMSLTDIDAPHTYTVVFEGQGGAAGFAKGSAHVTLEPVDESSTTLSYTAKAQVGGKLAQIGSRLVDGAARKIAGEFFKRFSAHVTGEAEPSTQSEEGPDAAGENAGAQPAQSAEPSVRAAEAAEHAPAGKGHKSWKAWISKF
jgi:carbon monoxide dehydrogenase subunit G